ncbi:MAG: cysteine synthase A [Clostridia bacterium]|nr:cysteine synthase A [Clostridia bacterium]
MKNSVSALIGNTPLIRLEKIEKLLGLKAELYAKLENFNPTGSAKDRAALYMIEDAEKRGLLQAGGCVVEPTSGNTGIGLALVCKKKGYKLFIVMPESMSEERRKLLAHYGAELVLTDGKAGMAGAIKKAEEMLAADRTMFMPDQFSNPANALAHYETTGPEIFEALPEVDIFTACVGTGGTLTGVGQFLKEQKSGVRVVAVEPSASPVLSGGKAGAHKIQGIGAGFVPKVLDTAVYDEVRTVTDGDAYDYARLLAKEEGLFVGISSGAALKAAVELAKENEGKKIVFVAPDSGDRYLSVF